MDWVKPIAGMMHRLVGVRAWAAGLAAFVLALALRILLGARVDSTPFLTFFPAIILAMLLGGWGPGVRRFDACERGPVTRTGHGHHAGPGTGARRLAQCTRRARVLEEPGTTLGVTFGTS